MPFKDAGGFEVSTGGYPWRLDGDFTSSAIITNVGKIRAAVGATVRPSTGPKYVFKSRYLEPGETTVFNLRAARDQQIPDFHGVKLNPEVTTGQFDWSAMFGDGTERMIGRMEVASPTLKVSSSFSCPICNCPYSTSSGSIAPADAVVSVGTGGNETVVIDESDVCGGYPPESYDLVPGSWNIATQGYFSLTTGSSPSTLTGKAVGTSSYYTPFTGTDYGFRSTGGCFVAANPVINPSGNGCVANLTFSGTHNSFIFVGTDSNILFGNGYFLQFSPTGGTFAGASTNSGDTFNFTAASGLEKAQVQTTVQSTNVGDRTLTFKYTAPSCTQPKTLTQNVTARQFHYVTNDNPSNQCTLTYGTDKTYTYTVYTEPDKTAVDAASGIDGTPVNEGFNPPLTCSTFTGNGGIKNGQFIDHVSSLCSSKPLTCTQTSTQSLSVSTYPVRTNTLTWTSTGVTYTSNGPTQ